MATNIKFNDFGSMMAENRPTMLQLDSEEMTRNEWKKYLKITDEIARTAYAYMAQGNGENFPAFRSAIHALYEFVGSDTRILAIDGYSVRFTSAVVPFKVVKSKDYKTAEKAIRNFKRAMEWACIVSNANSENPNARIFPDASTTAELEANYFHAETQDYYNAVVALFKKAVEEGRTFQVSDLNARLEALEAVRTDLAAQPWNCYKDFKNPMLSVGGKELKHAPASIRKNIEDTLADILTQRALMTEDQLEKEEAQIKGGKKTNKK